jgi:hypothetical protein
MQLPEIDKTNLYRMECPIFTGCEHASLCGTVQPCFCASPGPDEENPAAMERSYFLSTSLGAGFNLAAVNFPAREQRSRGVGAYVQNGAV